MHIAIYKEVCSNVHLASATHLTTHDCALVCASGFYKIHTPGMMASIINFVEPLIMFPICRDMAIWIVPATYIHISELMQKCIYHFHAFCVTAYHCEASVSFS